MSTGRVPFEYALLRVVPSVERGEVINGGVIVYCRVRDFLAARVHLDAERVRALDPRADVAAIAAALQSVADTCARPPDPVEAGTGASNNPLGQRFRWLTAPRSTVVQPGPVHTGLTTDPAAELDRLVALLVT